MATGNVTTTTAAAFIPEIWLDAVMYALRESLEFRNVARIITTDKGKGDKVHIPKVSFSTARDKAADTEITFDVTTDTDVSITMSSHKYSALIVENIVEIQAIVDQLQARALQVGYPVAKAMDISLAGLYSGITAAVDGGALAAGTALGKLLTLKKTMDDANAPRDGRVLMVEPYTESILLQVSNFTSRDYVAGPVAMTEGAVGRILGFDVIPSNNIQTDSGSYVNMAFVRNFSLGLAISKDLGIRSWAENKHFGDALAADAIYGVGVLEADSACKFTVTVPAE